jgi:hypothetical protein
MNKYKGMKPGDLVTHVYYDAWLGIILKNHSDVDVYEILWNTGKVQQFDYQVIKRIP